MEASRVSDCREETGDGKGQGVGKGRGVKEIMSCARTHPGKSTE
jgi:hypothetical protein